MTPFSLRHQASRQARDLRIDLMRGYFVFVMTIDHLATFPAWTQVITGAGRLWTSAAEGFIAVSGVVLGMVYRDRVKSLGWEWSIRKIGKRALQLYGIAAAGHLVLATGDFLLRAFGGYPSKLPSNYLRVIEGVVLNTRYKFIGFDLLPLYAILLPLGLLAVYLLERGKWKWLLIGSVLIWHGHRIDPNWFSVFKANFQPAIWQLLFIIGVMVGYYRPQIRKWWTTAKISKRPFIFVLLPSTLVLLIVNYQVAFHNLWEGTSWQAYSTLLSDRIRLDPGRLLFSIMVLSAFYVFLTYFWGVASRVTGWLLLPLGQNALLAYVIQGFVAYIVQHLPGWPFPDHNPTGMGFIHLGVVLVVWTLTQSLVWLWKSIRKSQQVSAARSIPTA